MSRTCSVRRYKQGKWEIFDDMVSREQSLLVIWEFPEEDVSGAERLWTWPGDNDESGLGELALGHTLAELYPASALRPLPAGSVCGEVFPMGSETYGRFLCANRDMARMEAASKSAACGVFRVRLFQKAAPEKPEPLPMPEPETVLDRMSRFMDAPGKWDGTGCFHRAGIFLPNPWCEAPALHVAEDIGRHNCLDRLCGFAALHDISLLGATLFVTARVTASLYAKARRIGFTELISRSAVTMHAVERARAEGVRLIGFCRPQDQRFTIFSPGPLPDDLKR